MQLLAYELNSSFVLVDIFAFFIILLEVRRRPVLCFLLWGGRIPAGAIRGNMANLLADETFPAFVSPLLPGVGADGTDMTLLPTVEAGDFPGCWQLSTFRCHVSRLLAPSAYCWLFAFSG